MGASKDLQQSDAAVVVLMEHPLRLASSVIHAHRDQKNMMGQTENSPPLLSTCGRFIKSSEQLSKRVND